MENELEPWVDTNSVARHMKKSYSYVRNLTKKKLIPCEKADPSDRDALLIDLAAMDEYDHRGRYARQRLAANLPTSQDERER